MVDPPRPPAVSTQGFEQGSNVKAGTELTLTCVSNGGNPLADVSKGMMVVMMMMIMMRRRKRRRQGRGEDEGDAGE